MHPQAMSFLLGIVWARKDGVLGWKALRGQTFLLLWEEDR